MFNDLFKKIVKSEKLGTKRPFDIEYSTGLDLVDYYNGSYTSNGIKKGIEGGRYLALVGPSGGSKTTFGIGLASNIVKGYDDGNIFLIDKERSTSKERFLNISKMTEEEFENKVFHIRDEFHTETFYKLIRNLCRSKIENKDKIGIDYKVEGSNEVHKVLPPSVVLLDSLAMLTPKELSGEIGDGDSKDELDGNMVHAQIAKANSGIFRRILPLLDDGNIFLIVINHLSTTININPFAKVTKQLNYLNDNEHLAGGNKVIYLANYIFKLSPGKRLKEDDDYGIKGFIVNVEMLKSRAAPAGTSFKLVYEQVNGFSNILSNMNFLYDEKLIKPGSDDFSVKFTKKKIKGLAATNKTFRKEIRAKTKKYLIDKVIPIPDRISSNVKEVLNDEEPITPPVGKKKKKK